MDCIALPRHTMSPTAPDDRYAVVRRDGVVVAVLRYTATNPSEVYALRDGETVENVDRCEAEAIGDAIDLCNDCGAVVVVGVGCAVCDEKATVNAEAQFIDTCPDCGGVIDFAIGCEEC